MHTYTKLYIVYCGEFSENIPHRMELTGPPLMYYLGKFRRYGLAEGSLSLEVGFESLIFLIFAFHACLLSLP